MNSINTVSSVNFGRNLENTFKKLAEKQELIDELTNKGKTPGQDLVNDRDKYKIRVEKAKNKYEKKHGPLSEVNVDDVSAQAEMKGFYSVPKKQAIVCFIASGPLAAGIKYLENGVGAVGDMITDPYTMLPATACAFAAGGFHILTKKASNNLSLMTRALKKKLKNNL